jgi:S1-C subfamily serine protease
VNHARLGIEGATAWADRGEAEYPAGVGVSGLPGDSPFQASGGQINDVIVEIAGTPVNTLDDLLAILRRLRAGNVVSVRILRADAETTLEVVLGQLNP